MSSIPAPPNSLLRVENLNVRFSLWKSELHAVRNLSFSVAHEKVAIVGESGSGKSLTGKAILGILPPSAHVSADRMSFGEIDLLHASDAQMRAVRGKQITLIMQDPRYSLHPLMRVGQQIAEACRLHNKASRRDAQDQALEMLRQVQIDNPERVFNLYPHEVSGGMGQRIMIAMMMVPSPRLIIADEPTSALDVVVRSQVLKTLDDLVTSRGMGLIFISHDLNLVRSFCDRVIVMYRGQVVEQLAASGLEQAQHPYTRGLLDAVPHSGEKRRRLPTLTRQASWHESVQ